MIRLRCSKSGKLTTKNNIFGHPDIGLLIFRVLISSALYINHGHEKLFHFEEMREKIADPFHFGGLPTLLIAGISDVLGSFMLFIGYKTRLAALLIAINTLTAFIYVQHLHITELRGEIAFLYLCASLSLIFTGAGKYSLDHRQSQSIQP